MCESRGAILNVKRFGVNRLKMGQVHYLMNYHKN